MTITKRWCLLRFRLCCNELCPCKRRTEITYRKHKDISQNYYLIKKNDSILKLTKMSNDERIAFFNKHIEGIKAKEAKEELERKKAEKESKNRVETVAFSLLGNTDTTILSWISMEAKASNFANQSQYFRKAKKNLSKIWENRALTDNWRLLPK